MRCIQEQITDNQKSRLTFVQHELQVTHPLQHLIIRFLTAKRIHLCLQSIPDIRPSCKHMERVTQQASRRIAASKQNVQQLITQPFGILRRLCKLIQKHIPLARALTFLPTIHKRLLLLHILPFAHRERTMHEFIHKLVHGDTVVIKLLVAVEDLKPAQAIDRDQLVLRVVECGGEVRLLRAWGAVLAVDGLAEEELGCRVEGQHKEEGLQVDGAAIAGNFLDQLPDVGLEGLEVRYLGLGKVWPDECLDVSVNRLRIVPIKPRLSDPALDCRL